MKVACQAQISELDITFMIHEYIGRLDIAVNGIVRLHMRERREAAAQDMSEHRHTRRLPWRASASPTAAGRPMCMVVWLLRQQ